MTSPIPQVPARNTGRSEYTELARRIRSDGLLRRRYGYYWTKLVAVPVVLVAMILLFIIIGDTWWQLFLAAAFGIAFAQIAFLGHDAAHRQIFASGRFNDWTSLIVGDLFVGMSYGWWRSKHNRHHANPNKIGSDPDIELPVLSMTHEQRARPRSRVAAWVLSHQGLFFFPLLLLEGLSLHASSVRRVFQRGHLDRRWVEIVFLSIRLLGWIALVFLVLSPGRAAVFLAVELGVFGFYMGASFAPNHKGMPIVPASLKLDFLTRQTLMSRNIVGSRLIDVAMGGLNFQIEHHLFPSMPRPNLRRASHIIADYCRSHEVRYTEVGLIASYGTVVRYINRVGLGERDVFECPLLAQRSAI